MNEELQVRIAAIVERVLGQDLPVALASRFGMGLVITLIQVIVLPFIIWFIWKYVRRIWTILKIYHNSDKIIDLIDRASRADTDEKTAAGLQQLRDMARDLDDSESIGISGFVCGIIALVIGIVLGIYWYGLVTELPQYLFFDGWVLEYLRNFIK